VNHSFIVNDWCFQSLCTKVYCEQKGKQDKGIYMWRNFILICSPPTGVWPLPIPPGSAIGSLWHICGDRPQKAHLCYQNKIITSVIANKILSCICVTKSSWTLGGTHCTNLYLSLREVWWPPVASEDSLCIIIIQHLSIVNPVDPQADFAGVHLQSDSQWWSTWHNKITLTGWPHLQAYHYLCVKWSKDDIWVGLSSYW